MDIAVTLQRLLYITTHMACTITSDKTPSLSPINEKSLYKKSLILTKVFFCQSLNTLFIGFISHAYSSLFCIAESTDHSFLIKEIEPYFSYSNHCLFLEKNIYDKKNHRLG